MPSFFPSLKIMSLEYGQNEYIKTPLPPFEKGGKKVPSK
jgi:hypothetical protein